tara:strand:- start:27 stop:545 length:519 start_codon:yes stop_codon:yes gene_type:complete
MDASSKFIDTLPTKPKELLAKFEEFKIKYRKYEHPPLFTVIDAKKYQKKMVGMHVKNLFLRDKKKRNFLLVTEQDAEINLKTLHNKIKSDRLSFGSPDRLWQYLGVRPGAVSPLALINDVGKSVTLLLQDILQTEQQIHFHPLVNDLTIGVDLGDLDAFFKFTGHETRFIKL